MVLKFRFTTNIDSPPTAFSAILGSAVTHPSALSIISVIPTFYHLPPFAPLAFLPTFVAQDVNPHLSIFNYCHCPPLMLLVRLPFCSPSPVASPILVSQEKARFLELSWATHCSHIGKELPLPISTSFSMLGALGLLLYYRTGFGGFFWLYLHLRFQSSRRLRSRYGRTLCTMIWNLYHHILFEERKDTNAISQW